MSQHLHLARETLLTAAGLIEADIEHILGRLYAPDIDAADVYFQSTRLESWVLEDGILKEGNHSIERGAGVRAISGEKTGFAYSNDLTLPLLLEAAQVARCIAQNGQQGRVHIKTAPVPPRLYPFLNPLESLPDSDKVALLRRIDAATRAMDPRIQQVIISLVMAHDVVLVVGLDGQLHGDVRPMTRLNVTVIAEHAGRREQGSNGGGGRRDLTWFLEAERWRTFTQEAVRQALINLEATEAPAGTMTVVLGPGWPGVLLHEAIGHGLEGDFNRKGTSAFSGRLGEQVAAPGCTVVDDGTLPGRRGSLSMDDEGTPSQCTTLIENGILKGYLQDRLNARLMGVSSTGNGRRESYAHLPLPRMTNTYMLPGNYSHEEIIASVPRGLYAANFGGGQVDITSGKFVFSASEAYLIENGKITRPVKGATLIGNGPDVLTRVSLVGNDLQLDQGIGTCGKDGQSVPVGVGQPTIRVENLTVGGTEA